MSRVEIDISSLTGGRIPNITGVDKIEKNREICTIYPYGVVTDRYGNESYSYDDNNTFTINVMWLPIASQVEIAEYGERINEMLQAVLYTDETINEQDRVLISDTFYTIISIKKFPSHRLLIAERVR